MEEENIDKLTKEILADSKLELTNPDFNNLLMSKIRYQNNKQTTRQNIFSYGILFISIDVLIYALLKILNIRITEIFSTVSSLSQSLLSSIGNGHFIFIYFLIMAVVIIGVNILSESRYRYRGI